MTIKQLTKGVPLVETDRQCWCGDPESEHWIAGLGPDDDDRPCGAPLCACPEFRDERDGP